MTANRTDSPRGSLPSWPTGSPRPRHRDRNDPVAPRAPGPPASERCPREALRVDVALRASDLVLHPIERCARLRSWCEGSSSLRESSNQLFDISDHVDVAHLT